VNLEIVVYGTAKPAGSKRGFVIPGTTRVSITDANPQSKPWKNQVAQVAGYQMQGRDMFDGPLAVVFRFVVARPRGHFKKDGSLNATGLRNPHPAKRPDVLKLARGVEDALSKVVYRDDSQIVDERLVKEYGEPDRVEITITELGPEPILEPSMQGALKF
jgi:Holliday junction resolvase RusA-like endonuclease